jgi:hypothetical protein
VPLIRLVPGNILYGTLKGNMKEDKNNIEMDLKELGLAYVTVFVALRINSGDP